MSASTNKQKKSGSPILWSFMLLLILCGVGSLAFLGGQILTGGSLWGYLSAAIAPTPPPVVTITGIRSQAKLSTVEYTSITEVYKENLPEGWLDETLGTKESLLMLVYGDVQGGFDLEKLSEGDLWTDGKRVRLILPAPEIINSSIDFDRSKTVYYESSLLLDGENPDLQGEALAEAKKAIEKAALEGGILDQANNYGKLYFENFLYSLGFTDVEVVIDAQIFKE